MGPVGWAVRLARGPDARMAKEWKTCRRCMGNIRSQANFHFLIVSVNTFVS